MMPDIPHYLESTVAENGSVQDELLLALAQAAKNQTVALERIAKALERIADADETARKREKFR
jgi:hypothetical protein